VKRLIFPILMGTIGDAILISLGVWQLQRLAWKEEILARIDATITAEPVPLPAAVDAGTDGYRPVTVTGALGGEEIHVLTSVKDVGPGYRVISVLTSGDRRVMVDLSFVPQEAKNESRLAENLTVTGNLHWPSEVDGWTPAPDLAANIWFARDVPAMAAQLQAEPFLIVARDLSVAGSGSGLDVTPLPIDSAAISNDHLNYAITWFSLALVWAVMSGFLLFRVARTARKD
jgi:surfeit locus 1 family protein